MSRVEKVKNERKIKKRKISTIAQNKYITKECMYYGAISEIRNIIIYLWI